MVIYIQTLVIDTVRTRLLVTFAGCLLTLATVTLAVDSRCRLYRALLATTFGVAVFSTIGFAAGLQLIEPVAETYLPTTVAGVTLPFIRTIGGPLTHGSYGVLLSIALPTTLLYIVVSNQPVRKLGAAILFATSFAGFVVGQSRSTFLAVAIVISTIVVYLYHQSETTLRTSSKILYHFAKVGILVAALPAGYVLYAARPESAAIRFEQSIVAVNQLVRNPLLGTTREMIQAETGGYLIHNTLLGIGALFGLPALILLFIIWVTTVRSVAQSFVHGQDRVLSVILLTALIGGTVENMFYFGIFSKTTWFTFALVVSGAAALTQ